MTSLLEAKVYGDVELRFTKVVNRFFGQLSQRLYVFNSTTKHGDWYAIPIRDLGPNKKYKKNMGHTS